MADRIKGITVEIGGDTTGLNKALSGVNKEIKSTQSQLKDVERLLKMDPGNTELLRQKYELLNKSVGETEKKLDSLKDAEKQVQAQFERGDIGEDQYNALKREIIETESSLGKMKAEAKSAKSELDKIDEKPIEEVKKAADDAGDELEKAGKKASNFGDYLKAGAVVEGAKAIAGALKDVTEETKEYQKIMGSLEASSKLAGYSAEQTKESYKQLYGFLGDDQTAATTLANLQALGLTQDELTEMIKGTVGAWANYGDSIPIDSLAESINETAKVGKVTGTFADVLNWAGKSEDDFNEKLLACGNESERTKLIMQELASQGLEAAADEWKENNKALYENNQANAELQEQLALLGEKVLPIITTVVGAVAGFLEIFNELDGDVQLFILTAVALVAALGPLYSSFSALSSIMSFIVSHPIVLLMAAIAALVIFIGAKGDEIQAVLQKVDDFLQGIFLRDWTEVFGPGIGDVLNGFFATAKNVWDSTKKIFDGIIDFIRGVFTGEWKRAWKGVQEIFGGIFDGLAAIAKAPINAVISIINSLFSGVNSIIKKVNTIKNPFTGESFGVPTIGKIPYLAKGGILTQGSAVVGEAGPEMLTVDGNRAIVQPLSNQSSNTTNDGGINMVIYGAPGQNVEELAEIISDKINNEAGRKGAAFG